MELQLQHEMLLVVRREGGAHLGYNSFRSALELLDMVGKLPCLDFHEEKDPIVEQQEEKQRELIKRTVADAMREAGRAPEAPSRELIDQAVAEAVAPLRQQISALEAQLASLANGSPVVTTAQAAPRSDSATPPLASFASDGHRDPRHEPPAPMVASAADVTSAVAAAMQKQSDAHAAAMTAQARMHQEALAQMQQIVGQQMQQMSQMQQVSATERSEWLRAAVGTGLLTQLEHVPPRPVLAADRTWQHASDVLEACLQLPGRRQDLHQQDLWPSSPSRQTVPNARAHTPNPRTPNREAQEMAAPRLRRARR